MGGVAEVEIAATWATTQTVTTLEDSWAESHHQLIFTPGFFSVENSLVGFQLQRTLRREFPISNSPSTPNAKMARSIRSIRQQCSPVTRSQSRDVAVENLPTEGNSFSTTANAWREQWSASSQIQEKSQQLRFGLDVFLGKNHMKNQTKTWEFHGFPTFQNHQTQPKPNSTLSDSQGAFELGYTAQIDQWIEACQPGALRRWFGCGEVVAVGFHHLATGHQV